MGARVIVEDAVCIISKGAGIPIIDVTTVGVFALQIKLIPAVYPVTQVLFDGEFR